MTKNIFGKIPKNYLIIAAIVICLSIIFKSANIFIISLSLLITYKLLSPYISRLIFDSKLLILVLTSISYVILLQCSVLVSWLISHNFPLDATPSLLLIILFVFYGFDRHLNRKLPILTDDNTKIKCLNMQDIVSLITAIIIIGVIIIPPLSLHPTYAKSTAIMSLITGNVDDTGQLSLVNDNIQFNRGILYKSDAEGKTRNGGFYPAGWNSVSAIFIKTILPQIKTGSASLVAYALQKLFWFFVLLFLLSRVSLAVYKFLRNKQPTASSYVWIGTSALFMSYTFLLPIFKEGFYSFLPQLISTLLIIPILIQLIKEKNSSYSFRLLPILFIVGIGGSLAWILPLPAFFLTAVLVVLCLALNRKIDITKKNFKDILRRNILLLAFIFLAVLIQLYTMTHNSNASSTTFLAGILMGGGITTYNQSFYLLIGSGFLLSLFLGDKKTKRNIHILLILFASLILFCSYIYLVQMEHLGKNEYYYFKVLDILTLAAIPFCLTGLGIIVEKISNNGKNIIAATAISLIVVTAIPQVIGIDASTLSFARGYRAFSSQIDNSMLKELDQNVSQANYFNKKYSFFYTPDVTFYFQNEVAAMMAKSNTPDSECFTSVRHNIWTTPSINQLIDTITQNCLGYTIDLVTNETNFNAFTTAVADRGMDSTIVVKSY